MVMMTMIKIQRKHFPREYCLFARSNWDLIVRRITGAKVVDSFQRGQNNILISLFPCCRRLDFLEYCYDQANMFPNICSSLWTLLKGRHQHQECMKP